MIRLSIVIVTWNTKQLILDCLNSIYSIKDYEVLKDELEVIVIDNASKDGTKEEISKNFKDIKLIVNDENAGYAPGCNQGMRIAKGKYVLLLGSDTVLLDGSLIKSLAKLESEDELGAVGCKLIFPDGREQGNCKKFPTLKNAFYTYLSLDKMNYDYDMLWFNYDKEIYVDQIATTYLMARKDILERINYFDEDYKILYNDVDLCKKIWETGKKIKFIPDAVVIHHGSYSTKKARIKIRTIMYKDILRYFYRNFGVAAVFLVPVLFFRLLVVSFLK